jgi:PAS domain S-box-containing protein
VIENVESDHLSQVYQMYREGTDQLYPTDELPVIRALAGETTQVEDIVIRHPHRDIPIEVWSSPVLDHQGDIQYAIAAFVDITGRREAERALHESEQGLRAMFDAAPMGVARLDYEGNFLRVNQAFMDIMGYTEEELLKSTFMQLTHPDDMGPSMQMMRSLQSGECNHFFMEKQYIRKDGNTIWATLAVAAVRDNNNELLHTVAMVQDITDRRLSQEKMAAHEQRLREMALELTLAEERERRRIAADLHDRISQTLSLAQIKIESLRPSLNDQSAQDTLRQSVELDLSPPVLYDLGFEAAVEWLIEQYQRRDDMTISLISASISKPLTEAVSVLLFRSLRELLINVIKYSKAGHVQIILRCEEQKLLVEVKDDGVGFDVNALSSDNGSTHGYGLFSVREQLDRIGGRCNIDSTPGKGTHVIMEVAMLAETTD